MCNGYKAKGEIVVMELDEWNCHGERGNTDKERKNGSEQRIVLEIKSDSVHIP
jgi:hypothetical protein